MRIWYSDFELIHEVFDPRSFKALVKNVVFDVSG